VEYFNYISFGSWEWIEKKLPDITMGRGRMFEYTPSDIQKRLESLDLVSISFLETLPTFLCSEIKYQGNSDCMNIRLGRVTKINRGVKDVSMTFVEQFNFGEVQFDDVEAAKSIFSADRFQLSRTHWAVREGKGNEILARLSDHSPKIAELIGKKKAVDFVEDKVPLPPRDKKILGVANNVEGFLKLYYDLQKKSATEIFFRGHSDATYELTPSVLRKWDNGNWQFLPEEELLCKELLIAHHDEFASDEYCFDRLVRMQHYGLPTRLLDISSNPLVALYFACSGKPKIDKDGEVIIFYIAPGHLKYYDSDAVSCLSNLSNLTYDQKNKLDLWLDPEPFNQTEVVGKLIHHIKSEKGYFEKRIVPDDLWSILCVKAKRTNTRIKSQSGAFLLFGQEATLPDAGRKGIEISRISIQNKQHILDQLDRININATTVYPSIEATAVHLRDRRRLPDPV